MSQWLELNYTLTSDQLAELEMALESLDCTAITLEDADHNPILEPDPNTFPLWQTLNLRALFARQEDQSASQQSTTLDQALRAILSDRHSNWTQKPAAMSYKLIEDENWQRRCMQDFKPMCFEQRLWIVPSWHETPKDASISLRLDPGLAFGTGTHETTWLCLTWLAQQNIAPQTLIDYGCGSGILALAALALGSKQAWAVDHDPQARVACMQNAELNALSERITCLSGEQIIAPPYPPKTDLLIANILAEPLHQLAERFSKLLANRGQIVLSGILQHQVEPLLQTYQPWFTDFQVQQKNDWCLIAARKKPC